MLRGIFRGWGADGTLAAGMTTPLVVPTEGKGGP